jgi:RimJ/RimL family protein N-acetyltransferase
MLPQSVLQRRTALSAKPAPVVLSGKLVRLRPLDLETDLIELFAHSNGEAITLGDRHVDAYDPDLLIWRYMSGGPFADTEEMQRFLQPQLSAENGLCLCVVDISSSKPVGVCNYMNNYPEHLKIELGNIWYSPIVQRTGANLEATYLMLRHAFEIGYRRVEWKCDALNERSRHAALRMGFGFEGIQEHHFIIKGRNRDTAWFRILDSEWNDVKILLEKLLDATPE